jgi:hypothetical protein
MEIVAPGAHAYGVATFDVERRGLLPDTAGLPDHCGVAELTPLPDGQLMAMCSSSVEVYTGTIGPTGAWLEGPVPAGLRKALNISDRDLLYGTRLPETRVSGTVAGNTLDSAYVVVADGRLVAVTNVASGAPTAALIGRLPIEDGEWIPPGAVDVSGQQLVAGVGVFEERSLFQSFSSVLLAFPRSTLGGKRVVLHQSATELWVDRRSDAVVVADHLRKELFVIDPVDGTVTDTRNFRER